MTDFRRLMKFSRIWVPCLVASICLLAGVNNQSIDDPLGVYLSPNATLYCHEPRITAEFFSLTVCFFLRITKILPLPSYFITFRTKGLSVQLGTSPSGVLLRINDPSNTAMANTKARDVAQNEFLFETPTPALKWHHVCFEYNRNDTNVNFVVNNALEESSYQNEMESKEISSGFENITKETVFCLGDGRFEGDVVDVRMWFNLPGKLPLTLDQYCSTQTDYSPIVNFNKRWNFNKESTLKRYDKETLCKLPEQFIVIEPARAFEEAQKFCRSVGGKLATGEVVKRYLPTRSVEEESSCINQGTDAVSWVAQLMSSGNRESFTSECLAIDNEGNLVYIACVRRLTCSICEIKLYKYTLYGHDGHYFDYMYYMSRANNGRPIWHGIGGSLIEKQNNKTWVLSSLAHLTTWELKDLVLPTGRYGWTKEEENGEQSTYLLSFSRCKSWQFACSDGVCVDMYQRCDDVFDCPDRSDENDCIVVKKPVTYDEENTPPPREGEPLPVNLTYHVDVYNVNDISTHQGTASIDIGLTMTWYDPRIILQNLKTKKEKKNYFPCPMVWLPNIMAVSGDGNGSVLHTDQYERFCYTFSNVQTTNRSMTDPFMAHTTPGNTIPLYHYLGILASTPCSFILYKYPFDVQYCNITFKVTNAPGNRVFNKATEGRDVPYLNTRTILLEYQLMAITTHVGYIMAGTDNNTYFSITFHLHRMYGYHITNSYFPSLLMNIIAYSTFFFQVDDFTNRIMISLTAQLVLASLFTATITSSVKTPYLKLIDVWFVVIITFCFLITMCQVYVNVLLNSEKPPSKIVRKILKIKRPKFGNKPGSGASVDFDGPAAARKMNTCSIILVPSLIVILLFTYGILSIKF